MTQTQIPPTGQRTITKIMRSTKHSPYGPVAAGGTVPWKDREVMQEYALLSHNSAIFKKFNPGEGQMVRSAYAEVILKLCSNLVKRYNYFDELSAIPDKSGITTYKLIDLAVSQLKEGTLKLDSLGRVENAKEIGNEFSQVYEFLFKRTDLFFIFDKEQLSDGRFYLPQKYREAIGKMVDADDVAAVIIAKEMPERAKKEVRELSDRLGGTFWLNNGLLDKVEMSTLLRNYLKYGSVRVLCTKDRTAESNAIARAINEGIDEKHGFQAHQTERLMDYLVHSEKGESLKGALKICIPMVGAIKVLDHFFPGLTHVVGGALDDIFGAILPDASQSMGKGESPAEDGITRNFLQRAMRSIQSFAKRAGHAIPVALAGMAFIPSAFLFGYLSKVLYAPDSSVARKFLAGACFGLACGIGTVGTSIAATLREKKAIAKFHKDNGLPKGNYLKKAIHDSIFRIPFRIGHTVWGLPLQIGMSAAAAATSAAVFSHWLFVSGVGMMETILGMIFAFGYTHYAEREHRKIMRKLRVSDLPTIKTSAQKQEHTWPVA